MKVLKWLDDHFEEIFLVVFLVLIACVSLAQVIWKKAPFLESLTWSDEFCRFMWIWTVFISLPYTIRKGSMLRVSVVLDLMPQVVRKVINLAVDIVSMLCMGLLLLHRHLRHPHHARRAGQRRAVHRYAVAHVDGVQRDALRLCAGYPAGSSDDRDPYDALRREGTHNPGADHAGRGGGSRNG